MQRTNHTIHSPERFVLDTEVFKKDFEKLAETNSKNFYKNAPVKDPKSRKNMDVLFQKYTSSFGVTSLRKANEGNSISKGRKQKREVDSIQNEPSKKKPRKPWEKEEDDQLKRAVETNRSEKNTSTPGKYSNIIEFPVSWTAVKKISGLIDRNKEEIEKRWKNELNPLIRSKVVLEEDQEGILSLYSKYGNDWARISRVFQKNKGEGTYYPTKAIKKFINLVCRANA